MCLSEVEKPREYRDKFILAQGTVWKSSDFRNGQLAVWKSSDFRNGQLDVQQHAKDAKIEIVNTLRVSAPLRLSR